MQLLNISGVALLVVAWLAGEPLLVAYRRSKVRREPFPEAWHEILKRRVPYFRSLPADLQLRLKKRIQVFLAEKPFLGCDGLEVTDEMRVTIAAQACLLILNRRTDYFANLRQIQASAGQPSLINHYGATNPAEFFAVSSEAFFEQPQRMAAEHPALYTELSRFYCVNPLSW